MSEEIQYASSHSPIVPPFPIVVRKRPGMFLGRLNLSGLTSLLKGIFSKYLSAHHAEVVTLELTGPVSATLTFHGMQTPVEDFWTEFELVTFRPIVVGLQVLNAVSTTFSIHLHQEGQQVFTQQFTRGELVSGDSYTTPISCTQLQVEFTLDLEIWKEPIELNAIYLTHEVREFAYLYRNVKLHLLYQVEDEPCKVTYYFQNGLQDRIEIEGINGYSESYFKNHFVEKLGDFEVEVAFAFREFAVDQPFLKSFVNDFYTHENGTHVDGLLQGLTYGVMKYFQKHHLVHRYKISEKGMRESLIAAIHIRMKEPTFSGCVKNKLSNPEVLEPISTYVADLLFQQIEADPEATQKLIRKFES